PRPPVRLEREAERFYRRTGAVTNRRRQSTNGAIRGPADWRGLAAGVRGRGAGSAGRVVLHDLLPVDDAVAGGTGLDRLAALQDVVELRRDVHVAPLAGAVADADDHQAPTHADIAVALEHVRPHVRGDLVALDTQLGDLPLDLGHTLLRRVAVLRDRRLQRLDVARAVREQLLL